MYLDFIYNYYFDFNFNTDCIHCTHLFNTYDNNCFYSFFHITGNPVLSKRRIKEIRTLRDKMMTSAGLQLLHAHVETEEDRNDDEKKQNLIDKIDRNGNWQCDDQQNGNGNGHEHGNSHEHRNGNSRGNSAGSGNGNHIGHGSNGNGNGSKNGKVRVRRNSSSNSVDSVNRAAITR